tara:strand:- start:13061 stop:13660 length:600 start_codon:yes stop_codon:yes gene_type:complete
MNKNSVKNVELELKLLNEIERKKNHSQRSLSKNLNVALGLANAILKKFVNKGVLKLKQAPMRRYFYYLTPKGFVEKTKLTKEFLKSSLQFYSIAKDEYEKEIIKLKLKRKKIILLGKSELTEIAILAANIHNLKIESILLKTSDEKSFCGVEIVNGIDSKRYNKLNTSLLLTDFSGKVDIYNDLKKNYEISCPKFLSLN